MPTKKLPLDKRKRLNLGEIPKRPDFVNLDLLNQVARAHFISKLSEEPKTWFIGRKCLKGMPWWLEVATPFFNENQIRLTYGMSHALFVEMHDAGEIPGGCRHPETGERVVRVETLLKRVVLDGRDWYLRRKRVPEIEADGSKRGRKKGKPPARTRQIDITEDQFRSLWGSDRKNKFRVPMDVAMVRTHDEAGRFIASATFDGRGKVEMAYGVDPDASNYVDIGDYEPTERESDPE